MFFYTTHLLNDIGLENRKRESGYIHLTKCPRKINMHFIELTI